MSAATVEAGPVESPPRYAFIDVLKGVAIVAMVVYHAAFDLSLERVFGINIIDDPAWTVFARLIAGTFIALVGFNLVLAHARGFGRRRFLKRLAVIVAMAAIVSLATWLTDPRTFVFFGILHQIALSSVLGALLLRAPSAALAGLAVVMFAAPAVFRAAIFDLPALWWVGLSAETPPSIDYVPLFPWFGVALAGMLAARAFLAAGTTSALARWRSEARPARFLTLAGRYTLPIYMIHQPILIGIIFLIAPLTGPAVERERAIFLDQCTPTCQAQGHGEAGCATFCTCMFEGIYDTDLFALGSLEEMTADQRARWDDTLSRCSAELAR